MVQAFHGRLLRDAALSRGPRGPELGTGNEADIDAMEGAVRLIWRSLVLAMFLLLLVSLAHALG